ncbi:hypothetical protein Tco_1461181, partial [Tanacetum coccineum]
MHVSDQDLDLLAKTRGKDLHTLKICTCTGFSEKGLLHISQYCNDLTSLCLEDNGVEDDNELVGKANGEWLRELALRNTSIESLHLGKANGECHAIKLKDFHGVIFDKDGDYTSIKFPPSIRGL